MIQFRRHVLSGAVLGAMAALPLASHATTGYLALGFGTQEMGMAGATSAAPQSAVAAAVNPAGMAFVGTRADLGIRTFIPIRESELDSSNFGGGVVSDSSSDRIFMIPAGGLNWQINDNWSAGLSFFGNGGMNATYKTNLYDRTAAVLGAAQAAAGGAPVNPTDVFNSGTGTGVPDTGILNIDLQQLMIIPSAAFKWDDKYSIGAGPIIAMQKVEVNGLGDFQCFTTTAQQGNAGCQTTGFPAADPQGSSNYPGLSQNLTDRGDEMRWGFGFRGGIQAKVMPNLSLAVAGATKVYMSNYEKYKELFAEQGDLDIPANITAGLGWNAMPDLLLTFDYQRIFYEGVAAISNKGPRGPFLQGNDLPKQNLGNDDGFGFGWRDINVYRVGAAYDTTLWGKGWTFRGGLAYNDQPIPDDELLFNILAPATVQWHLTLGASFKPTDYAALHLGWMWAFNEEVSTDTTAFGGDAPQNIPGSISMYQTSVDMGLSVLF
ncbi:MAG: outer membrane protein transport protein [Pseudomonadota bacterium]|nr:outer membrane protein transport protein [Pseudomonadota bacterium]